MPRAGTLPHSHFGSIEITGSGGGTRKQDWPVAALPDNAPRPVKNSRRASASIQIAGEMNRAAELAGGS